MADQSLTIAVRVPLPRHRRFLGIDTAGERFDLFCGCLLAVSAPVPFAWARVSILGGMLASDLTLLRLLVAGTCLPPVLLRFGPMSLARIGWPQGLALLATGGRCLSCHRRLVTFTRRLYMVA